MAAIERSSRTTNAPQSSPETAMPPDQIVIRECLSCGRSTSRGRLCCARCRNAFDTGWPVFSADTDSRQMLARFPVPRILGQGARGAFVACPECRRKFEVPRVALLLGRLRTPATRARAEPCRHGAARSGRARPPILRGRRLRRENSPLAARPCGLEGD